MSLHWTIDTAIPVRLAYVITEDCHNNWDTPDITKIMHQALLDTQRRFAHAVLSDDLIIQQIRLLFRAVGIDPTRYRPSGEALMRRAIKGEPVRSINPLVDINNICSMQSGLPMGCYDLAKIQGEQITVRLGHAAEEYQGVAKSISISGKLCLADAVGAFGSPISDSARTQVTEQTQQCLVVVFAHTSTDQTLLQKTLTQFIELATQHLNAQLVEQKILS